MAVSGTEQVTAYAEKKRQVCKDLKQMVVDQLCLDLDPEFITNDQPLFGRGLELDSIDSLELSVGVFNLYQISLSDDDKAVLSSINSLAEYVMEHQAKDASDGGADLSGGMDLG